MRFPKAALLFVLTVQACDCGGGSGLDKLEAELTIAPQAIDFGEVAIGGARTLSLTLKDEGNLLVEVRRFELAAQSDELAIGAAPSVLQPNEARAVDVIYRPANLGEDTATITVEGNDGLGAKTVTVRGIGVEAGITVAHDGESCAGDDGSIAFGAVPPSQTVRRTITLRVAGAPVRILSAQRDPLTSAEFEIDALAAGGVDLAEGSELTLEARYTPADGGADSGAFVIATSAPERPEIRIGVCGSGIAPAICAHPLPLDFGSESATMVTLPLTIESCGLEPLELSALAIANDAAHPSNAAFTLESPPSLPRTLAPSETIEVQVTLASGQIGELQGWIKADSNAYGLPSAYFPLTGHGRKACDLYVAPASIVFNNIASGDTAERSVLVANNGAGTCTISRLAVSTGTTAFHLAGNTTNPPFTIGTGAAVTIGVEYAPASAGPDTGVLEVESESGAQSVALSGNPVLDSGCQLEVAPTFLNFGSTPVGSMKALGVQVNNISTSPCILSGVELAAGSDPAFASGASGFGFILGGRSKQLAVTFRPTQSGSAHGELHIESSDVDTPDFTVPLFGASGQTGICVSPRLLPFGPTASMSTMSFNISACGSADVTVFGLDWTTPDPEISILTNLIFPLTLRAGDTQVVDVQYAPVDMDGDYAALTVASDDPVSPLILVEMTGGLEIVPPEAGRFIYYWSIPNQNQSDVLKLPLQGVTTPYSFWGPGSGHGCSGCHHVSPDGRYVALIEFTSGLALKIIEVSSGLEIQLPQMIRSQRISYFSWNPDVNTVPPYQFAYDAPTSLTGTDYRIHLGAAFDGYLGELSGANDPAYSQMMPSWGPSGQIAFARGTAGLAGNAGVGSLSGPADIMLIDVAGGTPVALSGASGTTAAHYYPAFSPDGRWIAFTESAAANGTFAATDAQLRVITSTGGAALPLDQINVANAPSSYPTWSVDGRFLSFSSDRPGGAGGSDIYIAPFDPLTGVDGAPTNLMQANTSGFDHSAEWSP